MEQFGLALILFAAFWVGCAAGYIAMRLRSQVAYENGRNDSAAEISTLTERLSGREQQFNEARSRAEASAETIARLEGELRSETDRRTVAEAKLTLVPKLEAELESRGQKLGEQQKDLIKLHASVSELGTRLEESKKHSEGNAGAIEALQAKVAESLQSLSAEALAKVQHPGTGSTDRQQALLSDVIGPLHLSLERVDARIGELEKERAEAYAGLRQQVESMMRAQVALQAETAHLASALRTPSSRGRWGEVQLRRVVELAGMIAHCDFIEPRGTEDTASRPDLIVQLPNRRKIAVDSKISLAAYLESNDAGEESVRLEKRRQHAAQVRAHVEQLSAKGYWDQFPQSPEFVVAFLPGEAFFSAALEHDPSLLEFGVERRVILATPTTLIALLRAVAWGWKQEMVSSNAREIRDLGKTLYDRLRTLAESFTEIQRNLSRTTAAFNRTVGSFEQSVIPAARRLRDAGASSGDEIVSPPPVDTTPRFLHLLAEATEIEQGKLLALTGASELQAAASAAKPAPAPEPMAVAQAATAPRAVTKPAAPPTRPAGSPVANGHAAAATKPAAVPQAPPPPEPEPLKPAEAAAPPPLLEPVPATT
ncbi:MAG: DNA recombination protein RmuC [Acidobacteria bacterium]|nr:DNA recombination protein RmuC [Acidobacteriota bacterium]